MSKRQEKRPTEDKALRHWQNEGCPTCPKFYNWLPENLRQTKMQQMEGEFVIAFPAAYAMRIMGNRKLLWENALSLKDGFTYKTAPKPLIDRAIKFCRKNNLTYKVYSL